MNNIKFEPGLSLSVVVSSPASPAAGDPVRYGVQTGIAVTAIAQGGNDATHTTVNFGTYVCTIPVTSSGAIAVGDALFFKDGVGVTNDASAAAYFFGISMGVIAAGTATIDVFHSTSPGAGIYGAGTIATASLAAGLLSADAPGRAKFAAGFFDAATLLAKFAAGGIVESLINPISNNNLNLRRTARFVWDFATDAHVVGTVAFRGDTLPAKARIVSGECYIKNALTGAGGTTASIQVTGAGDIIVDAAVAGVPWSTSDAMVPVVPVNTTATCVKSEAAGGKPSLVITTHDLTAGNIELYLNYIIHD